MSRARRKPSAGPARYLAPAAFLLGVTIAVLLVHSALSHRTTSTPTTTPAAGTTSSFSTPGTTAGRPQAKRFTTVQSGDTFGSIAAKEGISVSELQALNPGVSSNALQVGQKLRVK